MRVAKWGNSLAVRLPDAVVKALKLKTGDEIEIVACGARRFEIGRDRSREKALQPGQKRSWLKEASSACRVLLSEDLQHGRKFGGVTFQNPFLEET